MIHRRNMHGSCKILLRRRCARRAAQDGLTYGSLDSALIRRCGRRGSWQNSSGPRTDPPGFLVWADWWTALETSLTSVDEVMTAPGRSALADGAVELPGGD